MGMEFVPLCGGMEIDMKKIRVLHILSDTNIGGAGKLLFTLGCSIDKSRFEFIYVFPEGSRLIKLFRDAGCEIITLKGGKDRSVDLGAWLEVKRIIKQIKPDIIHTHSSFFGKMGAKLARFDKRNVIYSKHCVFEIPKIMKNKIAKTLYRIADNAFSGRVIAVAQSAKRELVSCGISPDKIKVIINGCLPLRITSEFENRKIREELGIPEQSFIVGISARLEEYKGHKTLIEAAQMSKKEGIDDIVFLFLGNGSYEYELRKYAKKMKVDDQIIFLGFQDDVYKYVNLFDVNVNCSTGTETSSLSISEGLSVGKPILASNYGGNPYMVKHGVTGYLFEKSNSEELYRALMYMKNNRKALSYFSKNAIVDYRDRFSAESMARQYEEFYREIFRNSAHLKN